MDTSQGEKWNRPSQPLTAFIYYHELQHYTDETFENKLAPHFDLHKYS